MSLSKKVGDGSRDPEYEITKPEIKGGALMS